MAGIYVIEKDLIEKELSNLPIEEVWGIGKRENMEVYKDVDDRKNG